VQLWQKQMSCWRVSLCVRGANSKEPPCNVWRCRDGAIALAGGPAIPLCFVSCSNCGYTEVYNLQTLEGKDDLGGFLEILFAD